MRSLKDNFNAMVDTTIVITIGIVFVALMVFVYLVFVLHDSLIPTRPAFNNANNASNLAWNASNLEANNSLANITRGFDDAISLLMVAITIFILALAIGALLMLRGRQ